MHTFLLCNKECVHICTSRCVFTVAFNPLALHQLLSIYRVLGLSPTPVIKHYRVLGLGVKANVCVCVCVCVCVLVTQSCLTLCDPMR